MQTNKLHILLAEDDTNLGLVLQEYLEAKNFEVALCTDGAQALETFNRDSFDICLLDIMMPKMDGFEVAKQIRKKDKEIPLIFITAKGMKEDKIEGFTIGADDYLTKPFSMEELQLRIQAVMRRSNNSKKDNGEQLFTIGKFHFDAQQQTLKIGKESKKLTSKEAALLRLLALNLNETLERDTALNKVWGKDDYFTARSMDVFITKLRKYLKADPNVQILSIHGSGFKLLVTK